MRLVTSLMLAAPLARQSSRREGFTGLRRDIMHPMFRELFIDTDTDTDDLAAEDDQRRRAHRSRRARSAMIIQPAARNPQNRPRP